MRSGGGWLGGGGRSPRVDFGGPGRRRRRRRGPGRAPPPSGPPGGRAATAPAPPAAATASPGAGGTRALGCPPRGTLLSRFEFLSVGKTGATKKQQIMTALLMNRRKGYPNAQRVRGGPGLTAKASFPRSRSRGNTGQRRVGKRCLGASGWASAVVGDEAGEGRLEEVRHGADGEVLHQLQTPPCGCGMAANGWRESGKGEGEG